MTTGAVSLSPRSFINNSCQKRQTGAARDCGKNTDTFCASSAALLSREEQGETDVRVRSIPIPEGQKISDKGKKKEGRRHTDHKTVGMIWKGSFDRSTDRSATCRRHYAQSSSLLR